MHTLPAARLATDARMPAATSRSVCGLKLLVHTLPAARLATDARMPAATSRRGRRERWAMRLAANSAYGSIRQHVSAYVSIRPHTQEGSEGEVGDATSCEFSIRQHTATYVA